MKNNRKTDPDELQNVETKRRKLYRPYSLLNKIFATGIIPEEMVTSTFIGLQATPIPRNITITEPSVLLKIIQRRIY